MSGYSPSLPLTMGASDDTYEYITEITNLIRQNVKTILFTAPGERIWMPDFGVGLRNYLFELRTEELKEALTDKIRSQFSRYMPFLDLNAVVQAQVERSPEVMKIKIKYLIKPLSVFEILQLQYNALEKSITIAENQVDDLMSRGAR